MIKAFIDGFFSSLALIVAIGAQNAFVLRQGIAGAHIFWVCLICALSDVLLIHVGVYGLAAVEKQLPVLSQLMRYGGAAFLCIYGLLRLHAAWRGGATLSAAAGHSGQSLGKTALTALAITWLNPHVYLDTVMLLGSIAAHYPPWQGLFALGASLASVSFFFTLGYAARALRGYLARPQLWRLIELAIGLFMLYLALRLLNTP